MTKKITELAYKLYGKAYSELLATDLKDYSDKEKKQALSELIAESNTMRLGSEQLTWLTSNTTC